MIRGRVSRKELEKQGWKFVLIFGYTLYLFKKGKDRILWDCKSQVVTHRYKILQQSIASP